MWRWRDALDRPPTSYVNSRQGRHRLPVVTDLDVDVERHEPSAAVWETPLEGLLAQEQRDQVHVGLNRLSDLDRDTLVAFYFRGQSLVQMSDAFDSPIGTIKRRLHVARKRLAKELATLAPA